MNLTLQCGVKYPCHFLGKNPDDTGYIMFLFDMDCNLGIISFAPWFYPEKVVVEGAYKAIFCLFYIPEDPPAGFPTLPSLYYFFLAFTKNNGSYKTALIY